MCVREIKVILLEESSTTLNVQTIVLLYLGLVIDMSYMYLRGEMVGNIAEIVLYELCGNI